MAKFTDKKNNVYDFKITPYGTYLLSIGRFKPEYYAFFDDNMMYDSKYAGITNESQNSIHNRIKNETPYLGTQTIFEDIEVGRSTWEGDATNTYFQSDVLPTMQLPREDIFRIEGMIGDAWLEGNTQEIPAWKIVTLAGKIMSSSISDTTNNVLIPQVNIELDYIKKIRPSEPLADLVNSDVMMGLYTTEPFSDGNVVTLEVEDLSIYVEESNTALLTENFDIEVFEILKERSIATGNDTLRRLYFEKDYERIAGGILDEEAYNRNANLSYTTQSVDYYFDIKVDQEVEQEQACKAADLFNKDSYYVDLDFDCHTQQDEIVYNDIYGPVTEPEICL